MSGTIDLSVASVAAKSSASKRRPKRGPKRFEVSDSGVFLLGSAAEGEEDGEETKPIRLCSRLDVVGAVRDYEGEGWGRLLRWRDADGRPHEWVMPAAVLAEDPGAVRARLMAGGLEVVLGLRGAAKDALAAYLAEVPPGAPLRAVGRTGWTGDGRAFVVPGWSAGAEQVLFAAAGEVVPWRTAGTAESWRDSIGRLCEGNSRLVLACSVGFGGPLLQAAGIGGGGFHLCGPSSTGKTTALGVGASVVGGGPDGGAGWHSWRATSNGLESIATAHNDVTLCIDELAQLDPRAAADAAYLLANGRPKERMTRTIQHRRAQEWRLLFLSTGELTLAEHAAAAGGRIRAGAEVRVLNIAADAGAGLGLFQELHGRPSPAALADELRGAARENFGAVFRRFVELLIERPAEVGPMLQACRERAARWVPAGACGEVGRAAERFAVAAAAGELATRAGLTGWPVGEALRAAQRCFFAWLGGRGTAGALDVEAGLRALRHFIERHGGARFAAAGGLASDPDGDGLRDRAGWRRTGPDGRTEYLILPEVLRREVVAGFDPSAVLAEARERRWLRAESDRLMLQARAGGRLLRVYCVTDRILEGGDEDGAEDGPERRDVVSFEGVAM
jgi:putative DNA primase/helicase